MFYLMNFVRFFMNYAIFRELCDRMRFEVDCAKSHHRVIPEGVPSAYVKTVSWSHMEITTMAKYLYISTAVLNFLEMYMYPWSVAKLN